jgi:ELWxxDGT repeat protein
MTKSLLGIFAFLSFTTATSQAIDATLIENSFLYDSSPWSVTAIGGKIYFSAITNSFGRELWVHDTASGMTTMVKDIVEGPENGMADTKFIKAGTDIYFVAKGNYYEALWRTDGTAAGTYMVKQIWGSGDSNITLIDVIDEQLIFSGNDGIHGNEIWVSNGTPEGTLMLKDIRPGDYGSDPYNAFMMNGELHFTAVGQTVSIWKTDGTVEGTVMANVQNTQGKVIEMNGNYYFYSYQAASGMELWKTNGTVAGTQLVKDISPGTAGSAESFKGARLNNKIIFVAQTPALGYELWSTDGTSGGTVLLKDINPTAGSLNSFNQDIFTLHQGKLYFMAYNETYGAELWTTDGTTAGTVLVKDIYPGNDSSNIERITSTGGFLIFSARNQTGSSTVWKSDGTAAGTIELAAVGVTGNSNMEFNFVPANGDAYFQAGYGTANGVELWKSSGTPETTSLLIDIDHSAGVRPSVQFGAKAELNGKLIYFGLTDGWFQPFVSDGTDAGTHQVKQIGSYNAVDFNDSTPMATKAGNNVYFRGTTNTSGGEIYMTDGTADGTKLVKDIAPGIASAISTSPMVTSFNNLFIFVANDQAHGYELWRTDGTDEGTFMLKDIYEGPSHGFNGQSNMHEGLRGFAELNGLLYFTASNGTQTSIYKTDGTVAGTQLAFNPYSSGFSDNRPVILGAANNKIFYKTNLHASSYGNHAIWSSDGTAASATLLGDYNTGSSDQLENAIVYDNKLFYSAVLNGFGKCLMKSNGTPAGTSMVKTNFPTQLQVKNMTACGEFVYFSLGEYGLPDSELWRSDGTTAGTIMVDGTAISGDEYFSDYVCNQQTLVYLSYNGNKFRFTNGYPENNQIREINVVNGDNFGEFYSLFGIAGIVNGKIFFSGHTGSAGAELYTTESGALLGLDNHTDVLNAPSVHVYPNPSSGTMTVEANDLSIITAIEVYDITGKRIVASAADSNAVQLDLSSISKGLYILKVVSDTMTVSTKIIVQ